MKNWQILLLGIFVGLVSAAIILLVTLPPRGKPVTLFSPTSDVSQHFSNIYSTPTSIMVHIAGEVKSPGLFSLPLNSRVSDGVLAAGGMTNLADPNRINLAAQLVDGMKVYVPAQGETITADNTENNQSQGINLPVNINLAGLEDLCALPGIGPTKAQAIIDYRSAFGAFSNIEEILAVPGIGETIFSQIKDIISVN